MAHRKSRSKQSPSSAVADANSTAPTVVSPAPDAAAMVRKSTCVLIALGTLLLGFYLGTLAPRFMEGAGQGTVAPASQAMQSTPGGQSPAPAQAVTPPMPPELAAEIARLEKSLLDDPKDARQWAMLGNLYFDTDQPHEAIKAYENSLKLEPGNANVLTDLGIMYRETGDFSQAVDCFRKAVQAEPRHENALFNQGVVLYYDLQRKEEGVAAWQQLLKLNPQARTPDGKPVVEMLKALN